jgi:hypothetical protein
VQTLGDLPADSVSEVRRQRLLDAFRDWRAG